jgi:uncharacterized YigZ family protein
LEGSPTVHQELTIMKSVFNTLKSTSAAHVARKGSKHHAYAYPIQNKKEVLNLIDLLRKEHPKANHICYAFILRSNSIEEYATDDGEPKHSAGSPILAQIKSRELQNVLVAVVRYFGGTKLGISGLIEAYGTAAREALEAAKIETIKEKVTLKLHLPYESEKTIKTLISREEAIIIQSEYSDTIYLHIAIEKDKFDNFNYALSNNNLRHYVV